MEALSRGLLASATVPPSGSTATAEVSGDELRSPDGAERGIDVPGLLRAGILDAGTIALLWLLLDGGVPLVVSGSVSRGERASIAQALLAIDPDRDWVLLDVDREQVTADRLAALLRGGSSIGLTLTAGDLEAVLERMTADGLPADAVRRLGVVAIVETTKHGLRCTVVHYLRPTERDAQGHLQRRPPAVLSAWDEREDSFEDYAWGITPELADRVDRAQADLEERRSERARFLARSVSGADYAEGVRAYLATEPQRVPAPTHEPATPSPFSGGLIDPSSHPHQH